MKLSSPDENSIRVRQMVNNLGASDLIGEDAEVEDALSFLEGYYGLPNYITVPVPEKVESANSRYARTVPERVMRLRGAERAAKNKETLSTD